MLKVCVKIGGNVVDFPSIIPGEGGSMVDYGDSTVLIFTCNQADDGALIQRSLKGIHAEIGDLRIVESLELMTVVTIPENKSFKIALKQKFGLTILILEHEKTIKNTKTN